MSYQSLAFLAAAACLLAGTALADTPLVSRSTGHVLLLQNERVMVGETQKVGEQYRVRRTVGETWIPALQVLCLCENMEEAYGALRRRANLADPDERLRLARWCHLHGLRDKALEEARAVDQMRPGHPDALRLERALERPPALVAPPHIRASVGSAKTDVTDSASSEVTSESLALFAGRVQPILMNTCACCHAAGHGGNFRLTRTFEGAAIDQRSTQQNLTASLAHINREHPEASALLARAVSVHGGTTQPPLKGRQSPAYRSMEEWVRLSSASQPMPLAAMPVSLPGSEASTPSRLTPEIRSGPDPRRAAEASDPAPSPRPTDPFDPAVFNRAMHPEGKDSSQKLTARPPVSD